jgi:hypothetical protein
MERGRAVPSSMRKRLEIAHQLLAHVEAAHEMGRDADLGQAHHEVFGDPVVQDPLAGDDALLLVVVSGGVVLEVLYQGAGFGAFVEHLRLAFINPSSSHDCHPMSEKPAGGLGLYE